MMGKGDVRPCSLIALPVVVGISWMVTGTRKSSDVTRAGSLGVLPCGGELAQVELNSARRQHESLSGLSSP